MFFLDQAGYENASEYKEKPRSSPRLIVGLPPTIDTAGRVDWSWSLVAGALSSRAGRESGTAPRTIRDRCNFPPTPLAHVAGSGFPFIHATRRFRSISPRDPQPREYPARHRSRAERRLRTESRWMYPVMVDRHREGHGGLPIAIAWDLRVVLVRTEALRV
jgi:hypothetical protein